VLYERQAVCRGAHVLPAPAMPAQAQGFLLHKLVSGAPSMVVAWNAKNAITFLHCLTMSCLLACAGCALSSAPLTASSATASASPLPAMASPA